MKAWSGVGSVLDTRSQLIKRHIVRNIWNCNFIGRYDQPTMTVLSLLVDAFVVLQILTVPVLSYRHSVKFQGAVKSDSKIFAFQSKSDRTKSKTESDAPYQNSKGMKSGKINVREQTNFVAEWQSRGDHYISYENLVKLDGMMTSSVGKSKSDRSNTLSELSVTYFARYTSVNNTHDGFCCRPFSLNFFEFLVNYDNAGFTTW